MFKIKSILVFLLFILLVFTRFQGLDWGMPYQMHPDERNMANSIMQLKCDWTMILKNSFSAKDCLNPNFFAYGQFSLYMGYFISLLIKFLQKDSVSPISFEVAAMSLRLISALASVFNVIVLLKITELLALKKFNIPFLRFVSLLLFTFSPFFIQFSHFGTTESLLMLFYCLIVYFSLAFLNNILPLGKFFLLAAFFSGLAIATKVSSVLFLILPLVALLEFHKGNKIWKFLSIFYLSALTLIFSILFSPHNFISFPEFLGAMRYESDVGLGTYRAFYTRQFEGVSPIVFQLVKIFPYSLGMSAFVFFLMGFIFLPFSREINLLRLALLVGFLPNAFFYSKWTRFVSPILPLMLIFSVLIIFKFRAELNNLINLTLNPGVKKVLSRLLAIGFGSLLIIFLLPGLGYLSIYSKPDIRFTVSDWIYQNIPPNSYVLSETANVIDAPIPNPKAKNSLAASNGYTINYISFDFYHLDENFDLQVQLDEHLVKAEYIFVPSRRLFANHYCPARPVTISPSITTSLISQNSVKIDYLSEFKLTPDCDFVRRKYPKLNEYYDKLFSGDLGFVQVAEFTEYPRIRLFGKTFFEFPDESAEETWTVFDHPVFRIYKRV